MKSQVMSLFTEIWLPSTALIIFLSVFITMLFFVFRGTSNTLYKKVEQLPFDEGKKKWVIKIKRVKTN